MVSNFYDAIIMATKQTKKHTINVMFHKLHWNTMKLHHYVVYDSGSTKLSVT